MIDFLDKNQGRQVEVKVICVGKNKSITVDGRNALVKKCGVGNLFKFFSNIVVYFQAEPV